MDRETREKNRKIKKRKARRIRKDILAVVYISLFIVLIFFFLFGRTYLQKAGLNDEIEKMKIRINMAEQENTVLRQELEYAESEDGMEETARKDLGLVKPGEIPIIIDRSGEDKD